VKATLRIRPRGTVTLPVEILRWYALKPNDRLIVEATENGILLKPASVPHTETYTERRIAEFEARNNHALAALFPDRRRRK
jgi:bifunctional DNA-binding transcriptional regulator/antitoxin component of YhaV-PrlF toxin-antitoxin module